MILLVLFLPGTKKQRICYHMMPKRINHIAKIVISNLYKLQFCNIYAKSSKSGSFLKHTKSLLTVVMQINVVSLAIFVYHNTSESMSVCPGNFNVSGKAVIYTHSGRIF